MELTACSGAATGDLDRSSSQAPVASAMSSGSPDTASPETIGGMSSSAGIAGHQAGEKSGAASLLSSGSGSSGQARDAGGAEGDAATAKDAGAGGESEVCSPAACPGGVCWQQLDGVEECVHAPAEVPIVSCESVGSLCCSDDAECADGTAGRCISTRATYFGCGGAVPIGNKCNYAECAADADCLPSTPQGATLAACVPAGALGLYTAACIYGGCRTDQDCTLHPGGECRFGEAATHGTCDRRRVLFCAYPSDPCGSDSDCQQAGSFQVCVPEESYQGRHCAPAPPMYP
jgi:hypothetical protein